MSTLADVLEELGLAEFADKLADEGFVQPADLVEVFFLVIMLTSPVSLIQTLLPSAE